MNDDSGLTLIPMSYLGHDHYKAIYCPRVKGKGEDVMLPSFCMPSEYLPKRKVAKISPVPKLALQASVAEVTDIGQDMVLQKQRALISPLMPAIGIPNGLIGRPRKYLAEEVLRRQDISMCKKAELLGVDKATISRRLAEKRKH